MRANSVFRESSKGMVCPSRLKGDPLTRNERVGFMNVVQSFLREENWGRLKLISSTTWVTPRPLSSKTRVPLPTVTGSMTNGTMVGLFFSGDGSSGAPVRSAKLVRPFSSRRMRMRGPSRRSSRTTTAMRVTELSSRSACRASKATKSPSPSRSRMKKPVTSAVRAKGLKRISSTPTCRFRTGETFSTSTYLTMLGSSRNPKAAYSAVQIVARINDFCHHLKFFHVFRIVAIWCSPRLEGEYSAE